MLYKQRHSLGKLEVADEYLEVADEYLEVVRAQGFFELPVSWQHADAVRRLPDYHKDPFDLILIAQTQIEDMTLLCSDSIIARYGIPLI